MQQTSEKRKMNASKMILSALLMLVMLAHFPPVVPLRSGHSCEDRRCYGVHLSPRPLTLREARHCCRRMAHGRGHLATIRSPAEARQLGSLLDSIAADFHAELWLGLRRDRRACEALPDTGPLRGFVWTTGGEGDARGAGTGDETYMAWQGDEPALSCSLAHCATLLHAGKGEVRETVVELRPRHCANETGVQGVVCRWAQEEIGGLPERVGRAEQEGEQREGGWAERGWGEGTQGEGERHKRDTKACKPGYKFDSVFDACRDVDECDDDNTCDNGLCSNTDGSFICDCFPGYFKFNSTICADVDECQEDHMCEQFECLNRDGFYECVCPAGYKQHANGLNCFDVDECSDRHQGGCMHTCENVEGSYVCTCKAGYDLGPDGKSCSEESTTAVTTLESTTMNDMALLANAQPSPGPLSKGPVTSLLLWLLLGLVSLAVIVMAGVVLFRRYRRSSQRQSEAGGGHSHAVGGPVHGQDVRLESQLLATTEASL